MTTTNRGKYVSFSTELDRKVFGDIIVVKLKRTYGYENEPENHTSYEQYSLEFTDSGDVVQLSVIAKFLSDLPEGGVFGMDEEDLEDFVRDWAESLAESAELPFTYTDIHGSRSTYTPQSLWESSGSCEWETSAQYGYDYGWNI